VAHICVPLLKQRIGECRANMGRCCFEIHNRAHFIADVNLKVRLDRLQIGGLWLTKKRTVLLM
jgi:hypothetical protein